MMKIPKYFQDWSILVVDDEEDNLDVALRLLKKTGAEVRTAENGQAALAMVAQESPHFILCDLSMPIMDGWLFLQELHETADYQAIPVFALTAHAMFGDRERVQRAGFAGYFSKPIDPMLFVNELVAQVGKIPHLQAQIQHEG